MSKIKQKKNKIRVFESGATRDTSEGKLDYYGFRHPLLEQSFAKYMHEHRIQMDGSLRDANNWWKGWDSLISLQSMVRHMEDLQALHAGLHVVETRCGSIVGKIYVQGDTEVAKKIQMWLKLGMDFKFITEEECLNAIRFNTQAYLLQHLTEK